MTDKYAEERGPTLDEYKAIDAKASPPNVMDAIDHVQRMAIANGMTAEETLKFIFNN